MYSLYSMNIITNAKNRNNATIIAAKTKFKQEVKLTIILCGSGIRQFSSLTRVILSNFNEIIYSSSLLELKYCLYSTETRPILDLNVLLQICSWIRLEKVHPLKHPYPRKCVPLFAIKRMPLRTNINFLVLILSVFPNKYIF